MHESLEQRIVVSYHFAGFARDEVPAYLIHRLQLDLYVNEIQLRRLKKRKLQLKDMITKLEEQLIPDISA